MKEKLLSEYAESIGQTCGKVSQYILTIKSQIQMREINNLGIMGS